MRTAPRPCDRIPEFASLLVWEQFPQAGQVGAERGDVLLDAGTPEVLDVKRYGTFERFEMGEELLGDDEVRAALSEDEIREKFDLGYHTKHVDTIFKRVFGDV